MPKFSTYPFPLNLCFTFQEAGNTNLLSSNRLQSSFLEFYISEILEYVLFCAWYIVILKVIHVIVYVRSFIVEQCSFVWIYYNLSTLVDGYLGSFQFFPIRIKTTINSHKQVYVDLCFVHLGQVLMNGIAKSSINVCLD